MIPVWNESRDQQTKALAKSDHDFSRRRWGQLLDWYDNITVSRIVVVKKNLYIKGLTIFTFFTTEPKIKKNSPPSQG